MVIKGAQRSYGKETQNFYIYIINKLINRPRNIYIFHQWIIQLFSEDNKVPEHWS